MEIVELAITQDSADPVGYHGAMRFRVVWADRVSAQAWNETVFIDAEGPWLNVSGSRLDARPLLPEPIINAIVALWPLWSAP
jgi:hypothetical protein